MGSSSVFRATLMATFGGAAGDLTTGLVRHYAISWADENFALSAASSGDSFHPQDSRSAANSYPAGGIGQLSSEYMTVTVTTGNTVIGLVDVMHVVPLDYKVTHAYIWASPTDPAETAGGIFYYVGKMKFNTDTRKFEGVYDGLSDELLVTRIAHTREWVCPPSFTSATRWSNRIVGIAGGNNLVIGTSTIGMYVRTATGSNILTLVDEDGLADSTLQWPRCMENEGFTVSVENSDRTYSIDQINPRNRCEAFLFVPFDGANQAAATFEAYGANKLYICSANQQQQELVRPSFILDGWIEFGDWLRAVVADLSENILYVFTASKTYAIGGVPTTETITTPTYFQPDYRAKISDKHGCTGPFAACQGPKGFVVSLTDTAVCLVSQNGAEDITNNDLRRFLASFGSEEKNKAVLMYDDTRHLFFIIMAPPLGTSRAGFSVFDSKELCIVLDVETQAWTVWSGGRWRAGCVATGADGKGSKVLFQDHRGDVLLLDDMRLVDKQGDTVAGSTGGAITAATSTTATLTTAPPSCVRGQYAVVMSGDSFGSFGVVQSISDKVITVDSWSSGTPEAGDTVLLGGIGVAYQTGAIRPLDGAKTHSLVSVNAEIETDSDQTDTIFTLQTYSGGQARSLPADDSPTRSRQATLRQLLLTRDIPLKRDAASGRVAFDVHWTQPDDDGVADATASRIRVNSLAITTSDEAMRKKADDA